MESVTAAELQVVIAFLDEPLADEALLILYDSTLIDLVLLNLHLEVHLFDFTKCPALSWLRFDGNRLL